MNVLKSIAVALFGGFVAGVFACRAQDAPERVSAGDQVPSFTVTMVDGSTIHMEDLRGKVVLVNFWATWCPPCRAELKRVQKDIVDRFAGEDFVFLPISRGEKKETVEKFRQENNYAFPMGLDPDQTIFKRFAETSIPRNYLVNREGVIVKSEIGYTPESFEELVTEIEKTLNTK